MEPKFNINTSQNVNIELKIAGIGDRLVAIIIDSLILGGVSIFLMILISVLPVNEEISIILFAIFGILMLLYYFFMEWLFNGQTIGKRYRNIKVIQVKGANASVFQLLIRNLIRIVDSIYGFGLVFIFLTKKSQRLGDLAAGTIVVKIDNLSGIEATAFQKIEADYEPVFGKVEILRLNENDIEMIKELTNRTTMEMNWKLIEMLTDKIKAKSEIDSTNLVALKFLQTIVSDFQYYALQ